MVLCATKHNYFVRLSFRFYLDLDFLTNFPSVTSVDNVEFFSMKIHRGVVKLPNPFVPRKDLMDEI